MSVDERVAHLSAPVVVGADEYVEQLVDERRRLTDDEDHDDDDHYEGEVVLTTRKRVRLSPLPG